MQQFNLIDLTQLLKPLSRSGLDAFVRYLATKKNRYVREISLPLLEAYRTFRVGKEKRDVKTAYNDELVVKSLFKWGSRASRGFFTVNPALDWETPEPVKPKRRCYRGYKKYCGEVGRREAIS